MLRHQPQRDDVQKIAKRALRVPTCWLMTDARLGPQIAAIIATMPPRSAVVVRPYAIDRDGAHALIRSIRRVSRAKRHLLLFAGSGDPVRQGFDARHGGHPPSQSSHSAAPLSVAVHNAREACRARRSGANFILISPIWPTRSHPGTAAIGHRTLAIFAAQAGAAAIALGGMDAKRFRAARRFGAQGWAAIDAWQQ